MMKKYSLTYWKETLQEKFCEYVDCQDPVEKNRIYSKYLHQPFLELIEKEVKRYENRIKFYSSDLLKNLKYDALSYLIEHVQKYNTTRAAQLIEEKGVGYGLAYCVTIVRAHMHDRLRKEHNKHLKFESFEELDLDNYENVEIPD